MRGIRRASRAVKAARCAATPSSGGGRPDAHVAGGVPCVRRFAPAQTGRVLLFATEDALHVVRQRLAGIALAAGRSLADLDIHVITAPSVRLDVERDRDALTATVAELRPKLLVLDPLSACTAS